MSKMLNVRYSILLATFVLLFLFAVRSGAQQTTGSIVGVVSDPKGMIVPNAQVTARNTSTGLSRTVATSQQGEYRIDFLPPGDYSVEIVASGFRTSVKSGIELQIGQFARVDTALVLGQVAETLEVTAAANNVNTTKGISLFWCLGRISS